MQRHGATEWLEPGTSTAPCWLSLSTRGAVLRPWNLILAGEWAPVWPLAAAELVTFRKGSCLLPPPERWTLPAQLYGYVTNTQTVSMKHTLRTYCNCVSTRCVGVYVAP